MSMRGMANRRKKCKWTMSSRQKESIEACGMLWNDAGPAVKDPVEPRQKRNDRQDGIERCDRQESKHDTPVATNP